MCVTGLGATSAVGDWEETLAFMREGGHASARM